MTASFGSSGVGTPTQEDQEATKDADEMVAEVYEKRRQQTIPHRFVKAPWLPWCAICSLHKNARVHADGGTP